MTARSSVHVKPGARVSGLTGREAGGAWKLSVKEPAREGRANQAVVALLAELIGVPRRAVRVVRGGSSRHKLIEVEGLELETLEARLRAALDSRSGSES